MKIHKHNVAMRWITRRRTNEVAGIFESFPGTFSAYQEALSDGFQGTMEEFIQQQSIPQIDRPFTGKVGGLVEPGVTHYGRPSKKGSNFYYRESTDEWIVYKRPPGAGGEKKQIYPFKKKSDALKFLKKGEEERLKKFEKTREFRTKEVNKAYDNINRWTKNWLNKNIPEYTPKEISRFQKDLAEAWAKELKTNSSLYPKDIKGIRFDPSTKTDLPWARELKLSGLTSPVDKTSDTFFKKVFYKEKLKNSEFKKKVKDYLEWVVADKKLKTTKAKYAGLETPGSQAGRLKHLETAKINQFDEDVIHLISEMQKGDPSGIYVNLKEQFPDLLKKYSYKVSLGTTKWRENLRVVAKNAGVDPDLLYKQMRNETAKVAKILGVSIDKIPDELRYAIDHLGGLAEAANYTGPNKAAFSRKTLNTLAARTREQNDILGRQTLSIPRSKLIRKFNKAKTLDDKVKIVGEINELVEKHIPGEIKYKVTGSGNLDFKALAPQKTIKERAAAYKKIPEVKNLISKIGCPGLAAGGRAKFQDGSTCYTRGVEKIKTGKLATAAEKSNFSKLTKMTGGLKKLGSFLFGPVEMGVLPLFMAGEGAYGRYANEQDYRKALKREGVDPKAIDDLAEVYGRELADLGNVGLESYAIDQENIPQTREFLKATGVSPLEYQQFASEKVKEERRTQAKEYAAALEKAQKEKFDPTMPVFKKGGRVPFVKGKLVDEGRRAFMKWLAGITGAGIAAGTGLLKWGAKKGAGKTVIKAGDHIIQGTPGMPDWFIPLVNRIVKEGDDVTKKLGTVEREIVHTKKINPNEEVTVYQNLDTGNVRVAYGPTHPRVSNDLNTIHLEYRAPEEVVTKKGSIKTKPEFDAVESEPKYVAVGPDDAEVQWDFDNIVGNVDDLTTDTSKLKEFGTNRKLTHRDKVIAKKKQKSREILETDTQAQVDYSVNKYGEGSDYDDYLPDIDDID